ncbi:MAG: PDZ domain-containing protein [Pyrinomonadaceae bacterium]|nr:PDZ domain-containing protein [Pyrinomonadaceae bacterium]
MRTEITIRLFVLLMLSSVFCAQVNAQTVGQPPAAAAPPKPAKVVVEKKFTRVNPVRRPLVIQNGTSAPQVVTILHGLNGLKLFRMLLRSDELAAIAKLDKAFQIENEIHTNVIAGLALDDGRTIAVWLPEAEAELPRMQLPYFPEAPAAPKTWKTPAPPVNTMPVPKGVPTARAPMAISGLPSAALAGMFQPADLKVVTRDGKRLVARYVGLDGLTGLSVITLANSSLPETVEKKEEMITVGQRLRLIGPEPASQSSPQANGGMYVRIGETEATVVKVSLTQAGTVRRVHIRSAKLTPANMGGIAINDAGETLGIVDGVKGTEATIVPLALVRNAVKRVIERQASVPRPWLGIQGEPIGALSFERILRGGWQADRARALAGKREGILLTSVSPGSPAALAHLRPGDVILRVNDDEVRNVEDFTWSFDGAGPGSSFKFTVARPEKLLSEALEIKLSESPDPHFGFRMFGPKKPKGPGQGTLISRGIETIALKPQAAVHFGASGGLLVVDVEPSTAAFEAGLRPGDVIEAINGHHVTSRPVPMSLLNNAGPTSTFQIVRNKQKIAITIQTE